MSWFTSLFSGSSGGSSSNFDWTGALLSGISAYSSSRAASRTASDNNKASIEGIKTQGSESRRTIAYEKALNDYYTQKDKLAKRKALDTYGSFSKLSSYAPSGYALPALPVVPSMPSG